MLIAIGTPYLSPASLHSPVKGECGSEQTFLLLVIANSRLDGVFGKYRAVDFHRRQGQFFCQLSVLDGLCFIQSLALHPLGSQGAGSNGRTAAIGLELG